MWCFSIYLGKATAVTRSAIPSSTSLCDILVFTWLKRQRSQDQRYPALAVYVFFFVFFACDFFSVYLGMASVAAAAAAAAGEMSSPQLTFCADSYWMTPFNPSVTAVAHKRPGHSARCAGSRLQLNTHTPLTQRSLSGLTMLSRQSVKTYQGNELGRNSSGNDCLQSPQLAELPWTDPTTTVICNSRIREKNNSLRWSGRQKLGRKISRQ